MKEHLQGESLAARLTNGPLPLDQALTMAAEIADALAAAHRQHIIPRDLKPGNVMLTSSGANRSGVTSAKLLDFGSAKAVDPHGGRGFSPGGHAGSQDPASKELASALTQAAPVTAKGTILGTLQYMAPEQLEGRETDARSDIFSFGAVLYEMVTGRRPFEGESQASIISAIMLSQPPPLSSIQPMTPPALDRVVRKCLAKDTEARWQNAADLADELRWMRETGVSQPVVTHINLIENWF